MLVHFKTCALLVLVLAGVAAHAATSDHLFVVGSDAFRGSAGSVVFDGRQFVAPVVQSNGALGLTFLDTNGVVASNVALSITGSSPRLTIVNGQSLLAYTIGTVDQKPACTVPGHTF